MRRIVTAVFTLWLMAIPAVSQVLEESGSLRDFLAGVNANSAYDNWISHVSEAIADSGYNDYGPESLDPQTGGFGTFRFIPNTPHGDETLEHWDAIFNTLFTGDLDTAAELVSDSLETFHYETVRFTDTEFDREYWMIREQLDMSYVDTSNTADPSDDIYGSFRNGWGVFIYNPDAARENVMIQVVHPCDDFFAPYAAIELFLNTDASTLCINGAGREVLWTNQGSYSNSKSKSDPSRNADHPLQRFHERFADQFIGLYPYPAIAIQLHSFDPSHNLHTANVLSAGYSQTIPTMPLRDLRFEGRDIVHLTPHPVFEAGDYVGNAGPLPELPVNEYYAINCTQNYYVHIGGNDSLLVPRATTLRGDPNNRQDNYLHDHIHNYYALQTIQPFLHVEMDEFPAYLEDGEVPRSDLFDLQVFPPEMGTYVPMLQFFEPFLSSIETWLTWMDNPFSIFMPPQIVGIEAFADGDGQVWVSWQSIADGHHLSYEVLGDTEPITEDSPVIWNSDDDPWLRVMGLDNWTIIDGLPLDETYNIAVRIRDLGGNAGPVSLPLQVSVADTLGIELLGNPSPEFPAEAWPLWVYTKPIQNDIESITTLWRLNGEVQGSLTLNPIGEQGYWAVALPENIEVQTADVVEYQLTSRDLSIDGNDLTFPEEGWFNVTLNAMTSVFEVVDFETPQGYVMLGGEWTIGPPEFGPDDAVSGVNVVATTPSGPYVGVGPSFLLILDRILPQYGPVLLVYEQWYEYLEDEDLPSAAIDGGQVGSNWAGFESLTPVGGYTHRIPEGIYAGNDVFSGSSDGWETVVVDLHEMYGAYADLVFQSMTFGETGLAGWYLDDIRIVREVNYELPQAFSLTYPADGDPAEFETIDFVWESCVDNDPQAFAEYTLFLTAGEQTLEIQGSTEPTVSVSLEDLDLAFNGPPIMTWSVRAISQGDTVLSNQTFTLVNPFSAIDENEGGIPKDYALTDVWPNPFNSTLSMRYQLPRSSHVKAILYNVLGQRVAVLENQVRTAGTHRISWQANGLASGVYLLHLETGGQEFTRKLVLMK
jgi:Secretion system C-terminal sorting domain